MQNSTLRLKSLLTKSIKGNLQFNKNNVSLSFLKVLYVLDPHSTGSLELVRKFDFAIGYFNLS